MGGTIMIVPEYDVLVTPIDEYNARIEYDGINEIFDPTTMFGAPNTVNIEQMLANIKFAYHITNQNDPSSLIFRNFINNTLGGIKLQVQRVFINRISQISNNNYRLIWGFTPDDASNGDEISIDYLNDLTSSIQYIIWNMGSLLRENNITSFDSNAVNLINNRKFRSF
jgi:hypothetical protein